MRPNQKWLGFFIAQQASSFERSPGPLGMVCNYTFISNLLVYWDVNTFFDELSITHQHIDIVQHDDYYPGGLTFNQQAERKNKYLFQSAELTDELSLGWYDFGLRGNYMPDLIRWGSVDPAADLYDSYSTYHFAGNNPVNNFELDGAAFFDDKYHFADGSTKTVETDDEPVYGSDGTYRGDTKEGFAGEVIIYDGKEDFTKLTKNQLLSKKGADTYDNQSGSLTGSAKSKIWTNIVSKMEGQQIYDEKFSLSSLSDGKISYSSTDPGSWNSRIKSKTITGTDKYSYETTVENIQASVVVHEWYSHIQKGNRDNIKSHRLAYKNVINYKSLWNNTTDAFKGFNVRQLLYYTKSETGRTTVDPLYLNIYNTYKNKR